MRHGHYWKLAGAKMAPANILCFDTETWHGDEAKVEGGEFQTLRLGCALAYRLEKGVRTRVKRITFTDPEPFWELVVSRLDKRRPLWVFAHNAAFDMGVVCGWEWLRETNIQVDKAAISGQLFYLKCIHNGCGLVFADTLNYYRCSLKQLGRAVGIHKSEMPTQESGDADWQRYCMQDVEVTAAGVDALIAFNRKERLGPWQPSIAGLAFSGYRAAFMKHQVLVHDDRPCLNLERGCYYGGLVDTPRIGEAPSTPIYELDVCSMYPSVCQYDLPYYKEGYSERVGMKVFDKLRKKYMLAAEVTIESPETPYPVRLKSGTYHPTGRFVTCLAHPELMRAVDAGHVKWIHRLAWYRYAPIAADYMKHFVRRKVEFKKADNAAFETLCKYYANNLYGKWGQMTPQWLEYGPEALAALEEQFGLREGLLQEKYPTAPDLYCPEAFRLFPEIKEPIPLRDYYGVVEMRVGECESRDSCPILAATVTSYARLLLRDYQKIAGEGNWYYCDTDSIWTNRVGYERLVAAGSVKQDTLGYLSLKHEHNRLVVFGPKDYECDTARRLKGIRAAAKPDGKGGWTQLHFPSAAAQIRLNKPGGVFVAEVLKHLRRELTKCVLLPDGKTRPLVFPLENPEGKNGKAVCRVAR